MTTTIPPRINPNVTGTTGTGTTTGTNNTQNTTATTSTTATTQVNNTTTTPANTTVVGNPNASGAGSVVQTVKLDGGYAAGGGNDPYAVAGQNVGSSIGSAGAKQANGSYDRGMIVPTSTRIDDKTFAIDVKTMHSNGYGSSLKGGDDKMKLFLETKIQGKDANGQNVEVIARLATILDGPANNVDAFNGQHRFVISYKELDDALKAHHPGLSLFDAKGNFTGAGATVAVRAVWGSGHNWGGYGRMGVTEVPAPAAKNNATNVQAGNVAQAGSKVTIAASEMPVDFEHIMPTAVQQKYTGIFEQGKPLKVSTRLERELKGKVATVEQHEAAIVRMQMIAAGYQPLIDEMRQKMTQELITKAKMKPSEAKAYAAKLHISPHTEWAQKDANGAFKDSTRLAEYKKDPQKLVTAGLAKDLKAAQEMIDFISKNNVVFHDPLPLEDKYNGKKSEMEKSVIRRIRSNDIAQGVYNVKPGPGKLQGDVDPSTAGEACGLIRARIEASVELKSKNVNRDEVTNYEKGDGSAYNVIGSLLMEAGVYVAGYPYGDAPGTNNQVIAFDMQQERHRFDIEIDGMKLDTSIDFVRVPNPPGPDVTRQIVEMELEHKFISPPTAGGGNAQTTPAAGGAATTTPAASSSGPQLKTSFSDLATQQKETQALVDPSLNVPPRFHRLSDLEDKELWQTKEQVYSNAVTNALISVIYPAGVTSCEQKGVEMARAMGKL